MKEILDLRNEYLIGPGESVSEEEMNTINMMLYIIKDKYNISGGAYHEMTQICKTLPRLYRLKDRIKELNKLWCIKPIPNGTDIQQSFTERLK